MASRHTLNQCWPIIEVLWHLLECNFTGNCQDHITKICQKLLIYKMRVSSYRAQWIKALKCNLFLINPFKCDIEQCSNHKKFITQPGTHEFIITVITTWKQNWDIVFHQCNDDIISLWNSMTKQYHYSPVSSINSLRPGDISKIIFSNLYSSLNLHWYTPWAGVYWWRVNVGPCDGLVPSGNKPSHGPMLSKFLSPYGITGSQWIKGWYLQYQCHPFIWKRIISQITQCIRQKSHNAPVCNRNVHTRPLFCYKMVHCGIWHWWLVHCGICATGQDQLFLSCNPL